MMADFRLHDEVSMSQMDRQKIKDLCTNSAICFVELCFF